MERLFSGSSPISLTTVGIVILVLLALDVLFTLGFAAVVSGRSRQDYDIPFLGAAANHLYNRSEQGRPLSLSFWRQLQHGMAGDHDGTFRPHLIEITKPVFPPCMLLIY